MDNTRLVLVFALSFVFLLLWQAWQRDYGPAAQVATVQTPAAPEVVDVPQAEALPPAPADAATVPDASTSAAQGRRIQVRTDVLEIAIDEVGATIERVSSLLARQAVVSGPAE